MLPALPQNSYLYEEIRVYFCLARREIFWRVGDNGSTRLVCLVWRGFGYLQVYLQDTYFSGDKFGDKRRMHRATSTSSRIVPPSGTLRAKNLPCRHSSARRTETGLAAREE
ncbi:hypothetical protein X947_3159 [Burkholderia pseudomallei MSHR7334]|nr:hypothetical protein X947_3159 [Burkholderia pseudomallei MSHR7334]